MSNVLESPQELSARDELCLYIRSQLLGPSDGESELIQSAAKDRYLLGTLYPREAGGEDFLDEDEIQNMSADSGLSADDISEERSDQAVVSSNDWLPSSLGLSFFTNSTQITCLCWGASYVSESKSWRRVSLAEPSDAEAVSLKMPSSGKGLGETI